MQIFYKLYNVTYKFPIHTKLNIFQLFSILVSKSHFLRVSCLIQVWVTSILNHRRWSAHEDQRIIGRWRQMITYHVLVDESLAVLPIFNENNCIINKPEDNKVRGIIRLFIFPAHADSISMYIL